MKNLHKSEGVTTRHNHYINFYFQEGKLKGCKVDVTGCDGRLNGAFSTPKCGGC